MRRVFDIIVVVAGPAGMAAAQVAAGSGARIAVVDDNPHAGGQIWRGGPLDSGDKRAIALWSSLSANSANGLVDFFPRTRICAPFGDGILLAETSDSSLTFEYGNLILATGARERLLPFPGWTLPGVTGAGGLQALSKGGYPVAGKRVVVAGSGPLLLAVAATLKAKGAHVTAILEQAPLHRLARFALSLVSTPAKLTQALQLRTTLAGVPYLSNSHVVSAQGNERLEQIEYLHRGRTKTITCDYLACGYGLIPNIELAATLGCALTDGAVHVDKFQASSVPHIYVAGETTGIGGVDLSLAEGRIAGLAAIGRLDQATQHFAERERWRAFACRVEHAFALRPALRMLCDADTIVCRCEDVRHGDLASHASWRSAKLHTRCGMGACQGRVCGGATEFLYGWTQDSVRPPLSPTRVSSLIVDNSGGHATISGFSTRRDTLSA
jgi:NADPH-dependent 2,4-dienoyl-CoA reductase/sulfur reductase-like enzyme